MNKFGAKKETVDGITFDSRAEARRYRTLRMLLSSGLIADLELQPVYELAPPVKIDGEARKRPALRYKPDFRYRTQSGTLVVEDVKGVVQRDFRIRQHLMKVIHGIDVKVVS